MLFFMGGLGGFLAGMLGVGGGVVFVLIFSHYLYAMGVPAQMIVPAIVANSMFAIFFGGISGSYKQWRNGNFFPREILAIALPAATTAISFSWLISHGSWYTRERFTIFFILLLIYMAWKIFRGKDQPVAEQRERKEPWKYVLTGSISGTVAAFSGIGGGIIIVPLLGNLVKTPIKKATSVSLGVITLMALLTSLFNTFFQRLPGTGSAEGLGLIFFSVAIPVALGSLCFSPVGVMASSRLKASHIRLIFVSFIMIVIVKMIYGLF